ncbi:AhpC/TSA family protein [Mucilaginibacter sp. SMC90]|uniref:TlpA disulfide reductase family protein n=1 Tax=Mucilaginibacter sp. SMC90 TaxID=2929803 RepID=UPI001FB51CC2|nr:TlpA disulfide reductase family protein [Mucilaginibacter sp. SMC90]UOE48875.1 AhpC/TSA family protein [Mucilaginibacter sp. SMC90]
MNHKFSIPAILFFLFLFVFQANAQSAKQGEFLVKGTIKGVSSGVIHLLSNGAVATDSAVITNGQFVMRGKIGQPEQKPFFITPGNWAFRAIIENGDITLEIDTTGAQHQYVKNSDYPLIWEIKESGSKVADAYNQFKNESGQTANIAILRKLKGPNSGYDEATANKKADSISTVLITKQKAWIENYINKYPESFAGVFIYSQFCELFSQLYNSTPPDLANILEKFSGPAKESDYYKALAAEAAIVKNTQLNNIAPDFTLLKRDKTKFTLSATKGKVTMIDFWASWCVPCRNAIPNWKKVYAKYHQKGLEIVSVANDKNWKDWITALDKEKMPWIQVIDEFVSTDKGSKSKALDMYSTHYIPFYVLLDREGKILMTSGNEDALTEKIAELLQ